jgi:hypothetical protein
VSSIGAVGQGEAMRARDIAVGLPTVTVLDPVVTAVRLMAVGGRPVDPAGLPDR